MARPAVPRDVLEFLMSGKSLEYDVENSEVGRIRLCSARDLKAVEIDISSDESEFSDLDPYAFMEGHYRAEGVNLVAESDNYEPLGILGWIPRYHCFGSWDSEHETLMLFEGATWSDIVANPGAYLDEQWQQTGLGRALPMPWLELEFHSHDFEFVIAPYGDSCPVHGEAIQRGVRPAHRSDVAELRDALRSRRLEDYLLKLDDEFPHPGVPCSPSEHLFCSWCFEAEQQWLIDEASQEPRPVTATSDGIIRCPECRKAFSIENRQVFVNSVHKTCGTRLVVT
jgi:hypothetical protein